MSTLVLVHGAWHGGWCWERVTPLLKEKGHEVVVVDLPGHGDSGVPFAEVTLAVYGNHAAEVLDEQVEPVMLVGHSMGGLVISEAAERRPEKIGLLVYLTGPAPGRGDPAGNGADGRGVYGPSECSRGRGAGNYYRQ